MAPPKRALFSLHTDTQADHTYQRVEDHNKDGPAKVKVLESSGPTVRNTHFEVVTTPSEKAVENTDKGVLDKTQRSEKGHTTSSSPGNYTVVKKTSKIGNRSSESRKNRIWEDYDTSEL
jgi:hypothetical protein